MEEHVLSILMAPGLNPSHLPLPRHKKKGRKKKNEAAKKVKCVSGQSTEKQEPSVYIGAVIRRLNIKH